MDRKQTEEAVARLVTPYLAHSGLTLWGVEFFAGSGRSLLRVYIEAEGGVDVEACAKVSRNLGAALEVENFIPGAYTLEVSSPGLERTFFAPEQLAGYLGRTLDVALVMPRGTRKRFSGELAGLTGDGFELAVEGETVAFAWDEIKKVKLVHDFSPHPQPDKGRAKQGLARTGGKK